MGFSLIDRIVELESGQRLTATKCLTLGEDYLQDHFPLFPVMPGVMMLEAMYQAAAWLLRERDDFAYSMVLLKEARAVKYAGFVCPGQTLQITVVVHKEDDEGVWFKAQGTVADEPAVSARLMLIRYNLASDRPEQALADEYIKTSMRRSFGLLKPTMRVDSTRG